MIMFQTLLKKDDNVPNSIKKRMIMFQTLFLKNLLKKG